MRKIDRGEYPEIMIVAFIILVALYIAYGVLWSEAPTGLKLFVGISLALVIFGVSDHLCNHLESRYRPSRWIVRTVQTIGVNLSIIAIISAYDGFRLIEHRIIFPGWRRLDVLSAKTKLAYDHYLDSEIDNLTVVEEYYPGSLMDCKL